MEFLSPWFLAALAAAAIPVVIHLVRRDRPQSIPFSTLRFLERPPRLSALLQRLQQWLVLALRIAIFALLALAFARPYLSGSIATLAGVEPSATVVLIDRSMSMRYGDSDARARDTAREVIASLDAGQEVAVVPFASDSEPLLELTGDTGRADAFVANLPSPTYAETRYLPALRLAASLLEDAPQARKDVILVSDFQKAGMEHFDPTWKLPPGIRLIPRPVGDERTRNLAVTDVRSPSHLVREAEEVPLLARVASLGSVPVERGEVRLLIDGEEVAAQTVDLGGRSEAVITFTPRLERGSHTGVIEVTDADFPDDNRFAFTMRVLPRIRVLVVSGESSDDWLQDESHWFDLAAGAGETAEFQVTRVPAAAAHARDLAEFEVVALLNVADPASVGTARLDAWLDAGGSLLVALGDQVDASRYARWSGGSRSFRIEDAWRSLEDEYLVIGDLDRRHPIFAGMGAGAWNAHVRAWWPVVPGASARVLMRYDNGDAALIEPTRDRGRLLLLTTALDTEWSDLPLQSLFLPFVHETLRYLAAREGQKRYYRVGESAEVPANLDAKALTTPDGATLPLARGRDGRTQTPPLAHPGFYSVTGEQGELPIAVNVSANEGEFTPFDPRQLEDQVVDRTAPVSPAEEVLVAQVAQQAEGNQRIWWWLLLAALLCALCEPAVANRTWR